MTKVLVADDDRVTRRILQAMLDGWGFEPVPVADGLAAWAALRQPDGPRIALLDWLMPGMDGVEVCRSARAVPSRQPPYLILLTVRDSRQDVVAGLESGADDYIVKPCNQAELRARLQTGLRTLRLQQNLAEELRKSEEALAQVKKLQGLLPICSYCKKIRDDQNYWRQVEEYIGAHADVSFSHGICPACWDSAVAPQLEWACAGPCAHVG